MNNVAEIKISYSHEISKKNRRKICSSRDSHRIFWEYWDMDLIELQEELNMILVTKCNEVLGVFNISKGGSCSTVIAPRIIFSTALACNAHGIILCHNHPRMSLVPSKKDIESTAMIKKLGDMLNVCLLDHLIITKEDYFSMADERIL